MFRIKTAAVVGALALSVAAVPLASAASGTSHAKVFESKTVGCGIEAPVPPHAATIVLCSATGGIPKPPGQTDGDPYVTLAKTGTPHLVLISQFSYETMKFSKLVPGDTWSNLGVTCKVGNPAVTCTNTDHHGFTIGNGKYKSF